MHITKLTISPRLHPAFMEEKITFELDKQVNLFIGPNATGKSSLLLILERRSPSGEADIDTSPDWESGKDDRLKLWGVPWIYIPATRIPLSRESDEDDQIKGIEETVIDAYNIQWQHSSRVFDGMWVEKSYKKLFDELKDKRQTVEDRENFWAILDASRIAYSCAKSICAEILTGGPSNYVSDPYIHITYPEDFDPLLSEPYVHPGMGTVTIDGQTGYLHQYVGNLSAGTQGVYLWVLYIALKIWEYYKLHRSLKSNDWKNQPAILLIDEIENHLHPTWQRRVIPALLAHFPGLQIFATTHSPFVVAGLKAGQVHLLNRDENGRVTATTNTEDVIGWTADEILRNMMGVDDPTDDATAAAARELRQLRQEPPRSNPEAEERRQQRMQELRQQVDRDLLAGGPMEAQRELFEQQFADVMKRYRQNQELNQENG